MKKFLSFILLCGLYSTLGLAQSSDETPQKKYELRFSPEDAAQFKAEALRNISAVQFLLENGQQLALKASQGFLGDRERVFVDMAWQKVRAGIVRILDDVRFTDSFMDMYAYFRDGLNFLTLIHPVSSHSSIVKRISLPALGSAELGKIVEVNLPLQRVDLSIPANRVFKINGRQIENPQNRDDTISDFLQSNSAIAMAKVINDLSVITGVEARVEPNVLHLDGMDFSTFAGKLSYNDLKISWLWMNQATTITSIGAFISLVNNFSNSTGVWASLTPHSISDVELTARDGRNMSVLVKNPALATAMGSRCKLNQECLQLGSITLRSTKPIQLEFDQFDYFQVPTSSMLVDGANDQALASVNISTQAAAEAAVLRFDAALAQVRAQMALLDF